MSKTGDKIFKYALDKGRSVKNTLWIAGCFLLGAANIAFFLLFPRIVSGLAIVLSNAITLIGMATTILLTYSLEPFLFRQCLKWGWYRKSIKALEP